MPSRIQRNLASLVLVLTGLMVSACGEEKEPPPPATNTPPTLTGPTASVGQVLPGEAITLTLTATDPDGDTLTYAWAQTPASPAGTFSSTTAASPTWTAPAVTGTQDFTLAVTVTDGKGGSKQSSINVTVAVGGQTNRPPSVDAITASVGQVPPGGAITLTLTATDPDGDTLTYAWAQTPASPAGTFSSTTAASPTWTAPAVTGTQDFTLAVTVTDGKGGSKQSSINVTVAVGGQTNRPPSVDAITAPSTLVAGTTGDFSIRASDDDGDPLTYTWVQEEPTPPGTWVGATSGTSAQWYSPPVGRTTDFTLKVSVTDGRNAPVVRTVTVPVTVPRYARDIQPVWSMGMCTDCHFGARDGLNLMEGSSYASLVNVSTINSLCSTRKRVTPNEPGNSALILKMEGQACGNRMPPGGDEPYFDINPGLLVRVRSWILAGAKED